MVRRMTAAVACAGVFSLAIGVGIAGAQSSSSRPRTPRPPATAETRPTPVVAQPVDTHLFVVQAALSNMAEIQLGHVATLKAQRPEIKKLAQTMIDEHVATQKGLAEAAYGAGIKWPTQINDQQRQLKLRLSTVKNDQFDREYLKAVVDGHRGAEKLLMQQMNGRPTDAALSAKLNEWAARTLPAIRARLQEAEQLYGEVEKGPRSARR